MCKSIHWLAELYVSMYQNNIHLGLTKTLAPHNLNYSDPKSTPHNFKWSDPNTCSPIFKNGMTKTPVSPQSQLVWPRHLHPHNLKWSDKNTCTILTHTTKCPLPHGENTNWPKQSKMEIHMHYLKSCIFNIKIVCCTETYLIHIYHMSKCNWYIEGFCMWNVHFHINGLSSNIAYAILMSWHLMAIYFLLLNYWLFYVQC